ncbi:MAG: chemotaxis protein CheA [Planctomycetota bacterium]|nr:chemotaxis protein CheA [Planctomycetota bacterium]
MSTERFEIIGKAKKVIQQIGLELAFVDSVNENGIDGINDLVRQLEAILGGEEPEQIRAGIDAVRQWIDERVAIDNKLSSVCITRLGDWQPWIDAAVMSWEYQLSYPTFPEGWKTPEGPPPAPVGNGAAAVAPGGQSSQAGPVPRPAARTVELLPEQTVDIVPPDSDLEMLQLFCAEAQDLLQDIEQGVLVLEVNPTDSSSLDSLFRAFHTFKGNVGVMKLMVLQQLAHELESMLDAARRGNYQLGSDSITVILAGSDILKRFVTELSNQIAGVDAGRTIDLPIPQLIHDVHSLLAGGSKAPAAQPPAAVKPMPAAPQAPSAPAVAAAVEADFAAIFHAPAPSPEAEPARSEPALAAPAAVAAAPVAKKQATNQQSAAPAVGSGIVRVDTVKLDGLIDLVGELVIAQSMVVQNPELKAITSAHLSRCLGQLRGITSDLQRTAMSLRMVPIRNTFQKMSRLVRDLALQQGKEIALSLEGEDTELDRNIVEELSDPLVHMIRNSADHGIEMPEARVAAGKPAAGTITLRAFHQGGFIVIQIEDDGRGLSAAKIRKKAIERGIIKADENLDEREIFDLIFAAGFSTAEKVTDLSGRGVGMDVVRRNIEKMRGKIEIS